MDHWWILSTTISVLACSTGTSLATFGAHRTLVQPKDSFEQSKKVTLAAPRSGVRDKDQQPQFRVLFRSEQWDRSQSLLPVG